MRLSNWWTISGALMLVGAAVALIFPNIASLTVVFLAGWTFLLGGAVQLIGAFAGPRSVGRSTGSRLFNILWAALAIWLAITLFANPLSGAVALAVAVAIVFAVSALVRLVLAAGFRRTPAFWGLILSAMVSAVLAFLIISELPGSATLFLGIYLGVELLFSGIALLTMGRAARRVEQSFGQSR